MPCELTPGPIKGNPCCGLCEKICISAKKIFDACVRHVAREDITIRLHNHMPPNPIPPLTFVSGRSMGTRGVISNVRLDRIADRPRETRLRCDVTVPMEIFYLDATGAEGRAEGDVTVANDIIMRVPAPSVMPFEIESSVSAVCPDGRIGDSYTADVEFCLTEIIKIIVEADILIPSYGYCETRPCVPFNEGICDTFFELPLFP